MFQIVRYSPIHCQITDGMIGTRAHVRPMTYHSERLAHLLAGRLYDEAYEGCSDDSFGVVKAGTSAFPSRRYDSDPVHASGDCPF